MPAAREALVRWQTASCRRAGLVFPAPSKAVYSREHRWGWDERRYGSDIPTRAGIERRVPFHALRHTCASMLVSGEWGRAWTIEEVCAFLGHSSITVTQRYAHLCRGALQRAASQTLATTPRTRPPMASNPSTNPSTAARTDRRLVTQVPVITTARPAGLEPATVSLEGCCSIRLSYGRFISLFQTLIMTQGEVWFPLRVGSAARGRERCVARRRGVQAGEV